MACVEYGQTCFTAGETITIDFQLLQNDGVTPEDLTGATAEMQLLESLSSISATVNMTGGLTDPVNGIGRFSLTKVESQNLLPLPITGEETTTKSYTSQIKITYVDTTVEFVSGLNVNIEQNAIR
jgi:hypothetical protein